MADQIRQMILKHLREGYSPPITVGEFARMVAAKVPRRTVYNYLHERKDCRVSTVEAIIEALGFKLRYQWTGSAEWVRPRNLRSQPNQG